MQQELFAKALQDIANISYAKGFEDGKKSIKIKETPKPEWIPALVKYQEIPSWWRMAEQKSKLMGEVILIKAVEPEETARFEAEYGSSKANFWSKRNDNGGKWYWNKADLILYPDSVEVEMYASAKFAHNKGQKKATAKK